MIEYLLRFLSKLQPISKDMQECLLKRFIAAISKQSIVMGDNMVPSGMICISEINSSIYGNIECKVPCCIIADRGFKRFREGTLKCTVEFLEALFLMVDIDQRQKTAMYMLEMNDNLKSNSDEESDVESGFQ